MTSFFLFSAFFTLSAVPLLSCPHPPSPCPPNPYLPYPQDDKLRMRNLERYLDFLLVPLIGGQGVEADNLSMLLQMLDTITTTYEDALEPSSSRIHATARVARKVCARACAGGAVMLGFFIA